MGSDKGGDAPAQDISSISTEFIAHLASKLPHASIYDIKELSDGRVISGRSGAIDWSGAWVWAGAGVIAALAVRPVVTRRGTGGWVIGVFLRGAAAGACGSIANVCVPWRRRAGAGASAAVASSGV